MLLLLTDDIWSAVFQQVDSSKSLLIARLVSKSFRNIISVEMVTGIPMETARLLWSPKRSRYGRLQLNGNEEVEYSLANEGDDLWALVYADQIRLTQYTANHNGPEKTVIRSTTTFTNTNSAVSFLWMRVTGNGLVCMLTLSTRNPASSPAVLSVVRCNFQNEEEKIGENVIVTSIDLKSIMRRSMFFDESADYTFSRNCMQCFSWKERSFVILLPVDERDSISLMEIKKTPCVKWVTWTLDCKHTKCIGCIGQTRNMLYIMPDNAGCVYTMNLEDENPRPAFHHSLPKLPNQVGGWFGRYSTTMQLVTTIASRLQVSENGENFIVYAQGTRQLFHLTKSTVRLLLNTQNKKSTQLHHVSDFSFVGGDNAVVCFFKDSTEYHLYNLKTMDIVRKFHFATTHHISFMGKKCIWSIGPTMSVCRLMSPPPDDE